VVVHGIMRYAPPRLQTVEEAEERGYRIMWVAGAMFAVGLLLTISLVFVFIGVPLMLVGALLALGDLVWMLHLAQRPVRDITCDNCEKPNRAFLDSGPFPCADCGRTLGEPVAKESPEQAAA
jgi:hypothetical protein